MVTGKAPGLQQRQGGKARATTRPTAPVNSSIVKVGVYAAIAGIVALSYWFMIAKRDRAHVDDKETRPISSRRVPVENTPARIGSFAPVQHAAPPAKSASAVESYIHARRLKQSRNYLTFAQATIEAAKSGDPDAQYYLAKALDFCDSTSKDAAYRVFFRRNGTELMADDSMQYPSELSKSEDLASLIHERCYELENGKEKDSEFGRPLDWIAKASNADQPAAQSALALAALQRFGDADTDLKNAMAVAHIENVEDARSLLMAAASTKDPEAIWNVGAAQGRFSQTYDDKLKNQLAWWLVSCQRGFDCDADADWIQMSCQTVGCPKDLAGPDFIRLMSRDCWQEVEQRAQEIADQLDAGELSQLDRQTPLSKSGSESVDFI